MFPFLDGAPSEWGQPLSAPDRDDLIAMLATLHRTDPAALRRTDPAAPLAAPARALLAGAAPQVRRHLDRLDRDTTRLASADVVITHGEPHPGNVMRTCRPPSPTSPGCPPSRR